MNIWRPQNFHGMNKNHFFEGWYFKNTSSQRDYVFAVIPGVSIGDDSHAFIQIIDNMNFSDYYRFKFEDFKFSKKPFWISIGENYFSLKGFSIKLDYIFAELKFKELTPWPVTIFSPGAMGYYGFFNFLECYHGILSFTHEIKGKVIVKGKNVEFNEGNGYIEKDWGRSFPKSWIWASSNNFENEKASFTLSIANVPFGRNYFVGFIIGLYLNGKIYRFTTYNGSKIEDLQIKENTMILKTKKGDQSIDVKILKKDGDILLSPQNGNMQGRIKESLNSEIEITLKSKGSTIFKGIGINAGLEINGDILEDIKNDKKGKISLKE